MDFHMEVELILFLDFFQIIALTITNDLSETGHSNPEWGIGGDWRFLDEVCHLDLHLDIFSGLCHTNILNFGSPC